MNARFFLAILAGSIVSFLLGWLIFDILTGEFYVSNSTRYEGLWKMPPSLAGIYAAQVLYAFVLAYVFQFWSNARTFIKGALDAAIIIFPISLGVDIFMWSTLNLYNIQLVFVDALLSTVLYAIAGGVIAMILKKNTPDTLPS